MAAQLIEEERLVEEAVLPEDGLDSLESFEITPEEPENTPEPEYEVPEKYQAKSMKDVIHMHQEAEKLLGRQSSEVGELRKTVDSYIQTQLETPKEQLEELDFFDNPAESVNQSISNHPDIVKARQVNERYQQETSMSQLRGKHPDMEDIVKDTNFAEWIDGSVIRKQLYERADKGFDVDAADELFNNWKERKGIAQQTLELDKVSRKQAIKAASTGNTRGSGESSSKTYRRSDIIKMMKTDPDRYEANADEIMNAYRQGRVK